MARAPLLVDVAIAAQALPIVAWVAARSRSRAATAIALGSVVGGLGDIASRQLAIRFHNNHVATYIDAPMMTICFLYALREWQVTPRERRAVTIGSALFLVGCVLLVAFLEDIGTFNFGVGPLASLALLTAGMWTLLRNAMIVEQTPLHTNDWFWASLGFALLGAATALASPIGGMLLEQGRIDLIDITWQVRGVFVTAAYCLLGWGVLRGPAVSRFATVV